MRCHVTEHGALPLDKYCATAASLALEREPLDSSRAIGIESEVDSASAFEPGVFEPVSRAKTQLRAAVIAVARRGWFYPQRHNSSQEAKMAEQASSETLKMFKVVRNDEEQYSVWPVNRDNPAGWHDAGYEDSREKCLEHIEDVWKDMRPLSLRRSQS
jgi:MbtH protein